VAFNIANKHSPSLLEVLKSLCEANPSPILVIGDVMLDKFLHGEITRISPEAPVPILKQTYEHTMPGGAGNVACNITNLGFECILIGVVGTDGVGTELQQLLTQQGVFAKLVSDEERITTIKTRFVSGSQQLLRCDNEETTPIKDETYQKIIKQLDELDRKPGAIVISDYAKGVVSRQLIEAIVDRAKADGIIVMTDPKSENFTLYKGSSVLTPNLKELENAVGYRLKDKEDIEAAARKVINAVECDAIVTTLGPKGAMLCVDKEEAVIFEARAREVFDVVGAGDTFIAMLATAIASRLDLSDAVSLANVGASLAVEKVGTASITRDELAEAIAYSGFKKTYTLNEALPRLDELRRKGIKIGFTNGCFDLFHSGHVSILEDARQNCDFLVVGLNSDASVTRLKGEDRPIRNENARAEVLKSMRAVDMVIVFDADTPDDLIKQLKPDVLIKGADYTIENVVGADFVISRNGRVHLSPLVEGESSSRILQDIRKQNGKADDLQAKRKA